MTHGSSSDTDDSGETACDGEEDTIGCEPVMKEPSFTCCFRMVHACKPDVISSAYTVKRISLRPSGNMIMNDCIHV